MAATLTQERFTSPEWIFERKVDGVRLLAFRRGSDVRLLSRNRLPQDCPSVAEQVAALPLREVILDGELTWSGPARCLAAVGGVGFLQFIKDAACNHFR